MRVVSVHLQPIPLFAMVCAHLVAAGLVAGLTLDVKRVAGDSMAPALHPGDLVLVARLPRGAPAWLPRLWLRRGSVVVLSRPRDHGLAVKRIVGLPDERVRISDGVLQVNGSPITEPYLAAPERPTENRRQETRVPPGHYFVLGDNRAVASDSRVWGPIPRTALRGIVLFVLVPGETVGRT
jgi:signal peptidase I